MSKAESLQVMGAFWNSLLRKDLDIQSPDWHQDILTVRQQKTAEGKGEYLALDELKAKHRYEYSVIEK